MAEHWLFPAVTATMTAAIFMTVVYTYLFVVNRDRFLAVWAIGWGVYSVRFMFMIAHLSTSAPYSRFILLYHLASILSGFILLCGTVDFTTGSMWPHPAWSAASLLNFIWVIAVHFTGAGGQAMTLPTFVLLGIVYIATGLQFLKIQKGDQIGKVVGWCFIVWGLHKLDYPVIRPIGWLAPWGYLIGAVLELTVSTGMILLFYDRARKNLRRSEERYRALFESSADAVFLHDGSGRIIEANSAAAILLGRSPEVMKGLSLSSFHPEGSEETIADRLAKAVETGIYRFETEIVHSSGEQIPVEVALATMGDGKELFIGVARDIRPMKKAFAEQSRLERLEAAGLISAGIAHDYNNYLSAIIGNVTLMKAMASQKGLAEFEAICGDIEAAVEMSTGLTSQLLEFHRPGPRSSQASGSAEIEEIVRNSIYFVTRAWSVSCRIDFEKDLGAASIEPALTSQILTNITINAVQAMEGTGTLDVRVRSVQGPAARSSGPPGKMIEITVTDSGPGIPDEVLEKVFQPYFTTKESGNGLGLSVSRKLLQARGGDLTACNAPGGGCEVRVLLPTVQTERN